MTVDHTYKNSGVDTQKSDQIVEYIKKSAQSSIEAILCLLAMRDSVAPPTINLEEPEEEAKIFNLVPKKPQDKKINCVMSNSFCVL